MEETKEGAQSSSSRKYLKEEERADRPALEEIYALFAGEREIQGGDGLSISRKEKGEKGGRLVEEGKRELFSTPTKGPRYCLRGDI